jgi:hypothetical protein
MALRDKIGVVFKNTNSTLSINQFEVYDNVGDELVGTFTLKGGESTTIYICGDSAGKGSVKIRNCEASENDWVEMHSIAPGDIISA